MVSIRVYSIVVPAVDAFLGLLSLIDDEHFLAHLADFNRLFLLTTCDAVYARLYSQKLTPALLHNGWLIQPVV